MGAYRRCVRGVIGGGNGATYWRHLVWRCEAWWERGVTVVVRPHFSVRPLARFARFHPTLHLRWGGIARSLVPPLTRSPIRQDPSAVGAAAWEGRRGVGGGGSLRVAGDARVQLRGRSSVVGVPWSERGRRDVGVGSGGRGGGVACLLPNEESRRWQRRGAGRRQAGGAAGAWRAYDHVGVHWRDDEASRGEAHLGDEGGGGGKGG